VGVAFAPEHGSEAKDIMFASDIALYRAKAAGRGQVRVYRQSEGNSGLGRQTLEMRLRQALAREEFEPFYQPQIDFRTNRVVAVEALIRWRHDGVVLSPPEFLPFAETNGLIVDLDRTMLSKVCADLAHIPEPIRVSVNMSVAQIFCEDVVEAFLGRLARANVAPGRVEAEITETMFLTNAARAASVMNALQDAGVSIALDDFGNGYSSLGYLRRFRFDKLKIDKIFVETLATDSKELEILRLVSALGKALNQTVVAEGIETAEQSRLVQLAGCDYGQGYFFARPMPLADLLGFIAQRNGSRDADVSRSAERKVIADFKSAF
jgi:EAL domain-containing protein (putative c-di-GMP-specific phosphodiesterase class I)